MMRRAKALYNNSPDTTDELCFNKGDILDVIQVDCEGQKGWWLCSLFGQRGICPANYLELLIENEHLENIGHFKKPVLTRALSLDHDSADTYDVPRGCKGYKGPGVDQRLLNKYSSLDKIGSFERSSLGSTLSPDDSTPERSSSDRSTPSPVSQNSWSSSVTALRHRNCSSERSSLYDNWNEQNPVTLRHRAGERDQLPLRVETEDDIYENIFDDTELPKNDYVNQYIIRSREPSPPPPALPRREPYIRVFPSRTASFETNGRNSYGSNVSSSRNSKIMVTEEATKASQEIYDVPRSSSRPGSSASFSGYGSGANLHHRDSKDSGLYDIPRPTNVKNYVNYLESHYDKVQLRRRTPSGGTGRNSVTSLGHNRNRSAGNFGHFHFTSAGSSAFGSPSVGSVQSEAGGFRKNHDAQDRGAEEDYDVPRSMSHISVTESSASGLGSTRSIAPITSHMSNLSLFPGDQPDYDIPPPIYKPISSLNGHSSLSLSSASSTQSSNLRHSEPLSKLSASTQHCMPSTSMSTASSATSISKSNGDDPITAFHLKTMPLSTQGALYVCDKLRNEIYKSAEDLGDIFKRHEWRRMDNLSREMPSFKFNSIRFSEATQSVSEFCRRTVSNAKTTNNSILVETLSQVMKPVLDKCLLVQRSVQVLSLHDWSVGKFGVLDTMKRSNKGLAQQDKITMLDFSDPIDNIAEVSITIRPDVHRMVEYLIRNAFALFGSQAEHNEVRTAPEYVVQTSEPSSSEGPEPDEDYDYVSLIPVASAPSLVNPGSGSGNTVSPTHSGGGGRSGGSSGGTTTPTNRVDQIDPKDDMLLEYYAADVERTMPSFGTAVAEFMAGIQRNANPDEFNMLLKYVVLYSFRVIFAGDIVRRNLIHADLKDDLQSLCTDLYNALTALRRAVEDATKHYPKMPPMQALLGKLWDVANLTNDLRKSLVNGAEGCIM